MPDVDSGDAARQGLDRSPWWLDNLADDATLEGAAMNGTAHGADAVREIVLKARELCEFQDVSLACDVGDNGFLEVHTASLRGEPLKVVLMVTCNAEGEARELAVLHRPRSSLLLLSRLMREAFAGTPLAEHFLSDES